jgi:hypothetical protein
MLNQSSYPYKTNQSFLDYEFSSQGTKGSITKIARFSLVQEGLYNFGFGDLNTETGEISDTVISNNGDGEKILVTVAKIIYHFTSVYQGARVFIRGTNQARTRRYQMGISKHWDAIQPFFEIYGLVGEKWEPFRKGVNYLAFIGWRKSPFFMPFNTKSSN